MPNQYITTKNMTKVRVRLNNSLMVSDSGKKITGTLIDFMIPEELIILPTDWLIMLEKKNQNTRPEVA